MKHLCMALARWWALTIILLTCTDGVRSGVTVIPKSRHEVTHGSSAPSIETVVLGTHLPILSTLHLSIEMDNCQTSAHRQRHQQPLGEHTHINIIHTLPVYVTLFFRQADVVGRLKLYCWAFFSNPLFSAVAQTTPVKCIPEVQS